MRFIVASRPGHRYHVPPPLRAERLDEVDLDTSSSAIRRALARGEKPPGVPECVLAYIAEKKLYAWPQGTEGVSGGPARPERSH